MKCLLVQKVTNRQIDRQITDRQFQIEGGGVVQGVIKLISTFFSFCDPKLKLGQKGLQKMRLILNFQEVKCFFKSAEKNPTCYRRSFFSLFFQQKKSKVWREFF